MTIYWIINCILVFLLCVFLAGIVIPQILLIAASKRLYDVPDERKIHKGAVPRLGGIAFKPVMFFSLALLVGINHSLGYDEMFEKISSEYLPMIYGYCAILLIFLVGMADDLVGVRYRNKFVAQILSAILILAGGLYIHSFDGFLGLSELSNWILYPFSILVVVFIVNAINLIDGIDGLASGLCSVAFLFYGIYLFLLADYFYALLSFAAIGVLVPFFYYNVFGDVHRGRKIFMGDTGSLTIGMLICIVTFRLAHSVAETESAYNSLVVAFSPLIVPCFDVVRVYLHRIQNGKSPFKPDKNHIHHKLLALGIPQRLAMILIILTSILYTVVNIELSRYVNMNLLLLVDGISWFTITSWLTKNIKKGRKYHFKSTIFAPKEN